MAKDDGLVKFAWQILNSEGGNARRKPDAIRIWQAKIAVDMKGVNENQGRASAREQQRKSRPKERRRPKKSAKKAAHKPSARRLRRGQPAKKAILKPSAKKALLQNCRSKREPSSSRSQTRVPAPHSRAKRRSALPSSRSRASRAASCFPGFGLNSEMELAQCVLLAGADSKIRALLRHFIGRGKAEDYQISQSRAAGRMPTTSSLEGCCQQVKSTFRSSSNLCFFRKAGCGICNGFQVSQSRRRFQSFLFILAGGGRFANNAGSGRWKSTAQPDRSPPANIRGVEFIGCPCATARGRSLPRQIPLFHGLRSRARPLKLSMRT